MKTTILVSHDRRAMAAGAAAAEAALRAEISKRGLDKDISVSATGSLGYEAGGACVLVMPLAVVYTPVTAADAADIIEAASKGRALERLAKPVSKSWKMPASGSHAEKLAAAQQRVILGNAGVIDPENIGEYVSAGGYGALAKALAMKPEEVIAEIKTSELRGRGGAGFPTATKWASAAQEKADIKYVVCNADEGEPGTFKDREIMEGDPHKLIEGMIIAGYAIGASKGYIYIRGEYALSISRLEKAAEAARAKGFLGEKVLGGNFAFDIEIARGAGAYICGEESALIESIEGKRGEPRRKPPYPAQKGLWQKPTVVNNVETLAAVPHIILNGGLWHKALGAEGARGTKIFSIAGDLNWKGVVEIPFGTPVSAIINEIGGGVKGGRKLKAVILGGVSGSLLTDSEIATPVDFNSLAKIEAGPGSGAVIVLDETRSVVEAVLNIARFFKHESCGRCTPCRAGTAQIVRILEKIRDGKAAEDDITKLESLARVMAQTSFCPLGQTAANILSQSLKKFAGEWEACLCAGCACGGNKK
ncbi:MAG: NADH-quinone oxidoreductase subunit NuoF [Elusimicrobiales bacterium]